MNYETIIAIYSGIIIVGSLTAVFWALYIVTVMIPKFREFAKEVVRSMGLAVPGEPVDEESEEDPREFIPSANFIEFETRDVFNKGETSKIVVHIPAIIQVQENILGTPPGVDPVPAIVTVGGLSIPVFGYSYEELKQICIEASYGRMISSFNDEKTEDEPAK